MRLSLLLIVCIGLLAYAGWGLGSAAGLSGWALAPLAGVFPVLVAAFLAAIGQAVATLMDPNPNRSTGAAAVTVYLRELGYFVACFLYAQPLRAWLMPTHRSPVNPRAVVVFAHGFACNRGLWWRWRRRWQHAGYATTVLDLAPSYWSVRVNRSQLASALSGLAERYPGLPLCVVGHSMGGLIGRLHLDEGEPSIACLVSLGAPHRGTRLAGQMGGLDHGPPVPASPWLLEINQRLAPVTRSNFLNICSANDCIVVPASSSSVDTASDWTRHHLGHMGLALSTRLCDQILQAVEQILKPRGAP